MATISSASSTAGRQSTGCLESVGGFSAGAMLLPSFDSAFASEDAVPLSPTMSSISSRVVSKMNLWWRASSAPLCSSRSSAARAGTNSDE